MSIPFPLQASNPFQLISNDIRLYNYSSRNNDSISIIAPTDGFIIMFKLPNNNGSGFEWKLFFLPERSSLIPSYHNWVAPLVRGFHFSTPQLNSDGDAAIKIVSNVFKQYVQNNNFEIQTVLQTTAGSYLEGSNIEIIPEARRNLLDWESMLFNDPTHELILDSATLFVNNNWGNNSSFLLPVKKENILFQLKGSGINIEIGLGVFNKTLTNLDNWISKDFFWFDTNEFYQRLYDDNLVTSHPSLPFNIRNSEQLTAAYRDPFYIHQTKDFKGESTSRRLDVYEGIQKLRISIPYEPQGNPPEPVIVEIPKEIFYVIPGEETNSIVATIKLPDNVKAVYRLRYNDDGIFESSLARRITLMNYKFEDLQVAQEGDEWIPSKRTALINFSSPNSSSTSGIEGDVEISFFVHYDISRKVRITINRLLRAKERLIRNINREHETSGFSLNDLMGLHNLFLQMTRSRGLSFQQKEAIREMMGQQKASDVRSAFSSFQRVSNRNINLLGDSLKLNLFERPYFMNLLKSNPELVELLAEAFFALEGTTDGNELIGIYANNFVQDGLGHSISGPNNSIRWTTLSAIWRRGRQWHKSISYIYKAFLEVYIIKSLTSIGTSSNPSSILTTIGEIENNLSTLFDSLGIEFTRTSAAIVSRPSFGGSTTEIFREFNYTLIYKNAPINSATADTVLDGINANRFSTPPRLSALGAALNTIDIVAKAIQLYSNPDRGMRNHFEFAATLGKFAAELTEVYRGTRFVIPLEGRWRISAFGGRAISFVRFLGVFGATLTLWRAIDGLTEAQRTTNTADDFLAGLNIFGASSVIVGELMLAFSTGPAGWVVLGIGTGIMFVAGFFSLIREAEQTISHSSHPQPLTVEDIYNGTALYYNYFGLRIFSFMSRNVRENVIPNRYKYQIETPETISRQYSSLASAFFQFEINIGRTTDIRGNDIIEAQIEADFLEPKSIIYFGLYSELNDTSGYENRLLDSIIFRLDQASGPNFTQSSRSAINSSSSTSGTVNTIVILKDLSIIRNISRIEVVISLHGIESRFTSNNFKDEFSNNFNHVVRRLLEI
ncbi:hypothetical protein [Flavivirga spongiicola]|uniref:Uncharacterized protein n=1 Tax=Flavivirga spongiicola TaxID=421621 RepID=A0ABU7XR61_9FLAO|nr:hypothetical protein [Flavivirga sp. MEBiC05379]MDO5978250.1 hypothetical protein [Flavivirga sp. MEBiC05379]